MAEVGKLAPDFTLETHYNAQLRLRQLRGNFVVLYFYPKDNTPGCTLEARQFQELLPQFEALGAHVFGISPDPVPTHCRFAEKLGLKFPLFADTDHQVAELYGVWGEKTLYGKKFMGVERATVLIDPKGKVIQVWRKVKADGHAQEVLEALRAATHTGRD